MDAGPGLDAGSGVDASPADDAGSDAAIDGAMDDGGSDDSGVAVDGGGSPDAGATDGGGPPDAGPPDAGPPDAGPPDSGPPDTGPPPCTSASECDDGSYCNGAERCMPSHPDADVVGCAPAASLPCGAGEGCSELTDTCVPLCVGPTSPADAPRRRRADHASRAADADDGGSSSADGDPCSTDADCNDGNFCNGADRCDLTGHCISAGAICIFAPCDEARDCCLDSRGDCSGVTPDYCASLGTRIDDFDGDGVLAIICGGADCDDRDANRYPGNAEVCDTAGHDEDCDPSTVGPRDTDGDGFLDENCCNDDPSGGRICGRDCDDSIPSVRPTAPEVCNDRDDDCDMGVDEGATVTRYRDEDGDGFGQPGCSASVCPGTSGYVSSDDDCNDANPSIGPGDSTCGLDPSTLLVCSGGSYVGSSCPSGTRCTLGPDGTGACL